MKIIKDKKEQGFAMLYVMLILASIMMSVSFAANQSAFMSANRLKAYVNSANERMLTEYCAENLLMQIRNNPSLTGSGTINFNGGSCDYSVSGAIPDKTINITASKNNLVKKITITTSQVYPTITATWLETN